MSSREITQEGLVDLVRTLYLYIGRYAESQLTTEQRDLLYDIANPEGSRWWRPHTSIQEDVNELAQIRENVALLIELAEPIGKRLEAAGVEPHMHGSGTYVDPLWDHTHVFDDPDHEHGDDEDIPERDRAKELDIP